MSMKTTVFWDAMLCSLIHVCRHFITFCLHQFSYSDCPWRPVSPSRIKIRQFRNNCFVRDIYFNWQGRIVLPKTDKCVLYACMVDIRLRSEHNPLGTVRCVSHTFNLSDVVKSIFALRWTRSEGLLLVRNTEREGSLNKQWNAVPEASNGCHS